MLFIFSQYFQVPWIDKLNNLSYYSLTILSTTALKSHSPFRIYNRFVEFWRSVLPNATQAESIFQSFDVGGYIPVWKEMCDDEKKTLHVAQKKIWREEHKGE